MSGSKYTPISLKEHICLLWYVVLRLLCVIYTLPLLFIFYLYVYIVFKRAREYLREEADRLTSQGWLIPSAATPSGDRLGGLMRSSEVQYPAVDAKRFVSFSAQLDAIAVFKYLRTIRKCTTYCIFNNWIKAALLINFCNNVFKIDKLTNRVDSLQYLMHCIYIVVLHFLQQHNNNNINTSTDWSPSSNNG